MPVPPIAKSPSRASLNGMVTAAAAKAMPPAGPVVHVLGTVLDQVADRLFAVWDKPLRSERFADDAGDHRARTHVSLYGTEEVTSLFKYHMHRLRVCRAWTISFALLAITTPVFARVRLSSLALAITGLLAFTLLTVASWATWRTLAHNDYERLAETYRFLLSEGEPTLDRRTGSSQVPTAQ